MASGNKELVLNTQKRIISPDYNRAQKFLARQIAEVMRAVLNNRQGSDDLAVGGEVALSTPDAPVKAEVMSGLPVEPRSPRRTSPSRAEY